MKDDSEQNKEKADSGQRIETPAPEQPEIKTDLPETKDQVQDELSEAVQEQVQDNLPEAKQDQEKSEEKIGEKAPRLVDPARLKRVGRTPEPPEKEEGKTEGFKPGEDSDAKKDTKRIGTIPLGRRPKFRPGVLFRRNLIDYEEEDVYVEARRKRLPPWLIPLVIFALIVAVVFWILPREVEQHVLATLPTLENNVQPTEESDAPAGTYVVVKAAVADILDEPFISGNRVTQALYNERLRVTDASDANYLAVELEDLTTGYVSRDLLSADLRSVLPPVGATKVIVRAPTKRIMSHAESGTLIAEVPMGTVLYADYESDLVMRLILPGGEEGWISKDDVFVISASEMLPKPENFVRMFTSSAMAFLNTRWVPSGQTISGISMEGVARLAAFLNGMELPRTLDAMVKCGEPVLLPNDNTTGLPDLRYLREGDLVFFSYTDNPKKIRSLAIVMPERQWMRAEQNRDSLRLLSISEDMEMANRIFAVRRLSEQ